MSNAQYETYLKFIQLWKERVGGYVQYRFSGGDPMVLKERLFQMADRGLVVTGQKPFILTAGKALTEHWAEEARAHAISHLFVSVENPFDPDSGAPNPVKVVDAIARCHTDAMPVLPGVCVVRNRSFHRLYDICEWFYERLGRIPLLSEMNFDTYESPTEVEWEALERNLERVVRAFHGKTPLRLFPYVSPELSYGGNDPYIFDLDLENSYGMDEENYVAKLDEFLARLDRENYPALACPKRECTWWEFCDNTKWFWQGDRRNDPTKKLRDYCRFKRILNDVHFRLLVDPSHERTNVAIDADAYVQVHGGIAPRDLGGPAMRATR